MRRLLLGGSMAVLAFCLIFLTGHWTAAQDAEPADEAVQQAEPSPEDEMADEIEDDEEHDDDWDEPWDEEHEEEIEEELRELELMAAHCEHSGMLSEMCENHAQTASWVISEIVEYLDEEEAAAFLQQVLSKVEEPSIRRMVRLKLAELYSELDQTEQVKEQLLHLILDR